MRDCDIVASGVYKASAPPSTQQTSKRMCLAAEDRFKQTGKVRTEEGSELFQKRFHHRQDTDPLKWFIWCIS